MAKKTDSKVSKKDSKASKVEKKNSKSEKTKKAATVGYCVRCKEKREMQKVTFNVNSRNMRMAKGKCKVCDTNMSAILGKAE